MQLVLKVQYDSLLPKYIKLISCLLLMVKQVFKMLIGRLKCRSTCFNSVM